MKTKQNKRKQMTIFKWKQLQRFVYCKYSQLSPALNAMILIESL